MEKMTIFREKKVQTKIEILFIYLFVTIPKFMSVRAHSKRTATILQQQ